MNRSLLLKEFGTRRISVSAQMIASEKFLNLTDQQREEKAEIILMMLKDSKTEEEFISKIQIL